jgi:hypothetical protein
MTGKSTEPSFENLKKLLSSICLRRSNKLLQLPALSYEDCRPNLTARERKHYNILVNTCNEALDRVLLRQALPNGKPGVLESLLRLRIYCNQGGGHFHGPNRIEPRDELLGLLQQSDDAICAYCGCDILMPDQDQLNIECHATAPRFTRCRKIICAECLPTHTFRSSKKMSHGSYRCCFCDNFDEDDHEYSSLPTYEGISQEQEELAPSKLLALMGNIQRSISSEKWFV